MKKWNEAVRKAKQELGTVGFVLLKKGGELYKRTKKIYATM